MSEGIEALLALNQLGFACVRCRERAAGYANSLRQVCKDCIRENEAKYEPQKLPAIAVHLSGIVQKWVHSSRRREAVVSASGENRQKLHNKHVDEKLSSTSQETHIGK